MKKKRTKKKILLRIVVILAVLIAAAVAGYFALFHNADVLQINEGKITGAKPTWLITSFTQENGQKTYRKLADVGTPRNFTTDKNAGRVSEDPLTTEFCLVGKDTEKNPESYQVLPVDGKPETYLGSDAEKTEDGSCWKITASAEETVMDYVMPSPYEEESILIRCTTPGEKDAETMLSFVDVMKQKVAPGKQLSAFVSDFKLNFLDDNRWMYLWNGLGITLEITFFSCLIGILLGALIASVRSTWDNNNESMRPGPGKSLLSFFNSVCKVYLTVIRGTPAVIQLMIMYYVIFASSRNGVLIAILSFGINSGAYVAEIIRGGIESIDRGQFEAGRSLGFNYFQTMVWIIIPQVFKNVLPALANEFIVMLKETFVAGYVAVMDLTKAGDVIRGVTYSAFLPLLAVAAIYLLLVMFFTWLVGKLERRLRSSDH